jgi:hypothetical protein
LDQSRQYLLGRRDELPELKLPERGKPDLENLEEADVSEGHSCLAVLR